MAYRKLPLIKRNGEGILIDSVHNGVHITIIKLDHSAIRRQPRCFQVSSSRV